MVMSLVVGSPLEQKAHNSMRFVPVTSTWAGRRGPRLAASRSQNQDVGDAGYVANA